MNLFQPLVVAHGGRLRAVLQEVLQFDGAGVGRRAAVTRDGERAAGIGDSQGLGPVLAGEPPLEQARHEAVAGAQHVEHLDLEGLAADPLVEARRDRPLEGGGAGGTSLADQRRLGDFADVGKRRARVGRAAGDVELLLGAHDHVEAVEDALQLGGHGPRFDEATLARPVPREAPEIGPIVDIEDRLRAARAGQIDRPQRCGLGARVRDVRARRQHAAGLSDEVGIDIVGRERHVRAVLAVENERELLLVTDAEKHQGRQTLGIGDDAAYVDPFCLQLLADEAAHVLVADAGYDRRLQAEPRGAGRRVGGRAADVLVERPHVLQAAADLAAVEVDR